MAVHYTFPSLFVFLACFPISSLPSLLSCSCGLLLFGFVLAIDIPANGCLSLLRCFTRVYILSLCMCSSFCCMSPSPPFLFSRWDLRLHWIIPSPSDLCICVPLQEALSFSCGPGIPFCYLFCCRDRSFAPTHIILDCHHLLSPCLSLLRVATNVFPRTPKQCLFAC